MITEQAFTENAFKTCSPNYRVLHTATVVDALKREGFEVVASNHARVRKQERLPYARHLVRMRAPNALTDEYAKELIIINSHLGNESLKLMLGVYRFACANGMIAGDTIQELRYRHTPTVTLDNVIEGAFTIIKDTDKMEGDIAKMKARTLDNSTRHDFGHAALTRFTAIPEEQKPMVLAHSMHTRRDQDRGVSAWHAFNVMQEYLIKGGIRYQGANRAATTRAITSVERQVEVNRGLWNLALEYAA